MTSIEKEQWKADTAFRQANRKQRIRTIKAPVVIKPTGAKFRVATQVVVNEDHAQKVKYLVQVCE